jgi:L-lysine exporter family protein LysE/ArgO
MPQSSRIMLQFISNLILGFVLVLAPGPVVTELFNKSLKEETKTSVLFILGVMLSELIWFIIVYLGVTSLFELSLVQIILGVFGGCFLIYLGISNITFKEESKEISKSKKNSFVSGFLINFLSPINIFMWIGIIATAMAINKEFIIISGILWGIFIGYVSLFALFYLGKKMFSKKVIRIISVISGIILIFYGLNAFWTVLT